MSVCFINKHNSQQVCNVFEFDDQCQHTLMWKTNDPWTDVSSPVLNTPPPLSPALVSMHSNMISFSEFECANSMMFVNVLFFFLTKQVVSRCQRCQTIEWALVFYTWQSLRRERITIRPIVYNLHECQGYTNAGKQIRRLIYRIDSPH